jgi:hypothetical protein
MIEAAPDWSSLQVIAVVKWSLPAPYASSITDRTIATKDMPS